MPYRALYIVMMVLRVLAYVGAVAALAGGVGGAIAAIAQGGGGQSAVVAVASLLGGVVGAFIVWLSFKAYAEWIELALASEGFLREAAGHLRALAGRGTMGPGGAR